MTITQTVDIPANRRLIIDVPREVTADKARVIVQFPAPKAETKPSEKIPVFGCAKGQFRMAEDFDAPLDDFKDYM